MFKVFKLLLVELCVRIWSYRGRLLSSVTSRLYICVNVCASPAADYTVHVVQVAARTFMTETR
jgi:hypothetical protein